MITIDTQMYPEKWIDYEESKILVKHPTREQSKELRHLMASGVGFDGKLDNGVMLDYAERFVSYTIKDWKNFLQDKDGNEIKCKTISNKLSIELLEYIARDSKVVYALYGVIFEALEWDDVDKKK